jgi:HEAT repeats
VRFLLVALLAVSAGARDRVAYIEFFGYQGLDPEAVRKELPFHEGDAIPPAAQAIVRAVVKRVTGKEATNVASVCCINDGDSVLFIGLAGTSSGTFAFNPRPAQDLTLSSEALQLVRAMDDAEDAATDRQEVDPPQGYRLMRDPKAHAAELKVRDYARAHSLELIRVLSHASDPNQRATAADGLGYAGRSPEQIDALVKAAHDHDDIVRNNATRALMEILDGDSAAAAMVPAAPFIEMLHSGTWTDRNKSCAVLESLTQSRDIAVLGTLKARAWDALLEMARWRTPAWSHDPRMILARIAGIEEDRALTLTLAPLPEFLQAISSARF